MLCAILGVAYVVVNFKKLKDKKIFKTLCISAVIIILAVLFFEVPLLEQKSAADYEVFRYGKMYSRESVPSHALSFNQLLIKNGQGADSNSMFFCLGIPLILGLLLLPFAYKRLPQEIKKQYKIFLIAGIIFTVMTTKYFPWAIMPDILLMVQFPWRILIMVVFCFSMIAGINYAIAIKIIKEKVKENKYITKKRVVNSIFILGSILAMVYSLSFTKKIEVKEIGTEHYKEEEIIDTKMEVSRYSSYLEYWPQKAVRNLKELIERGTEIRIIEGDLSIELQNKNGGRLEFEVKNTIKDTKIELPYLYYKGYEIKLTTINGESKLLETRESNKGLLEITVEKGTEGKIEVSYKMTMLHRICVVISFITIIGYIGYEVMKYFYQKHKIDCNTK